MSNENLTPINVINTLSLFLRVIIEQIWYNLEVYPKESFRSYSFYSLQVYSSRHPAVIEYLDCLENNIKKLMKEGILIRIYLEIYHEEINKYSIGFSFKNSLLFEQLKNDTQFIEFESSNQIFNTFSLINEMKSLLFSVMNELSGMSPVSSKKVGNFKILMSSMDDIEMTTDSNWILEKKLNVNDSIGPETERFESIDLKPFKEVVLGYLNIKSYIAIHK